jgi:hypothetical protein
VSRAVTLALSDELVQQAESEATQKQISVEEVLSTWLTQGMVDLMVDAQVAGSGALSAATGLSSTEKVQMGLLLRRAQPDLSGSEGISLDEWLRTYRQRLVRMAQAITDWLTVGGLRETETDVAQLVTVRSTMLYAVGYNAATETLEVVFNSGGIYRYFHVPPDIYRGLLAAESKGRYMWSNIFNLYPYTRLRRG